jgi:maltooligosyltrehalose trehalohydrolase
VFDDSESHVLREIATRAREAAAPRPIFLVAENEEQVSILARPVSRGGYGIDALWNDDFHHSAQVALTGKREAYYTDYAGTPQELVSAVRWGYLFQGQRYAWQKQRRGAASLDLPATAFVSYIQNHDQVANSATGARVHTLTAPGKHRAMIALMLLTPATPMLFQGEEFASSSPFLFFADHGPDLAKLVSVGRREFLSQVASAATKEIATRLAEPSSIQTFERSKLDWRETESHAHVLRLYKDLLALRRRDPTFASQRSDRVHGSVVGTDALLLRFLGDAADGRRDRLLLVNLGKDLCLDSSPDPLIAPPFGRRWRLLWSSESAIYGGNGTPDVEEADGTWKIPAYAAVAMSAGNHQEDETHADDAGRLEEG